MPMQMGFRWYGDGNDRISLCHGQRVAGVVDHQERAPGGNDGEREVPCKKAEEVRNPHQREDRGRERTRRGDQGMDRQERRRSVGRLVRIGRRDRAGLRGERHPPPPCEDVRTERTYDQGRGERGQDHREGDIKEK